MKTKFILCLTLLFIISFSLNAQHKPLVYVLATGGTIAGVGASKTGSGYTSGVISIDQIIATVPEIREIARIKGEQVVNIPSQDMS